MSVSLDNAPPSMFDHVCKVFEQMRQRSAVQHGEDGDMVVYEGFTTSLFAELGFAMPYYTKVLRMLKLMGCIKQLKRGGGAAKSQWLLMDEPDWDSFAKAEATIQQGELAPVSRISLNEGQIHDLNRRVTAMEAKLDLMLEAMRQGGQVG